MYLRFLKKYKIYVALLLALIAGFLLCLGTFFIFNSNEQTNPSKIQNSTDENLVYFDVKSQPSETSSPQSEIDDSELNVDEYNQEIAETLKPPKQIHLPEETPALIIDKPVTKNYFAPKYHKKSCKLKSYENIILQDYPHKIRPLRVRALSKKRPALIPKKPIFLPLPVQNSLEQELRAFKLEFVNAFELADFINKNIAPNLATAKGNSEIIFKGSQKDLLNAEKITALLDTKPKVSVFKLNYVKPYKMANMLANTLFNGNCSVSQEGEENAQKSPYAVYYNNSQNSVTIVGASKKQMDLAQEFIQFTDIKLPQAFLDIMIVELNDAGSRQFQKFSQFNSAQECIDYGISNQNIFGTIYNIICCGNGGKILAKPRITVSNDGCYNINITSDYVKSKLSKDVYNIEQDCGIKLKIHSDINAQREVFLTLEPQYVTVKRIIPGERNPKATLFNRKSFHLENIKLKDKQTLFFGGINSQQEFRKFGKTKTVNSELVMLVNVRLLD